MKIATFNVNGVNGRLPILLRWLDESKPDMVCLQELKAPQEKFPEAATGRSRNTARRYLQSGADATRRKQAPKPAEKLDPFKSYIMERVKAAAPDRIPAAILFREIKERSYLGGDTRVKEFVRALTPVAALEPVVRFETEPGRQMQADWASMGRGSGKLSVFIATLGWSWAAYLEFCGDERVETLIGCQENAFLAFAGRAVGSALR
ncbi:MAG: endonuclease/exonuclease/phosphatase family protein [Rhodomicrobium sp.]